MNILERLTKLKDESYDYIDLVNEPIGEAQELLEKMFSWQNCEVEIGTYSSNNLSYSVFITAKDPDTGKQYEVYVEAKPLISNTSIRELDEDDYYDEDRI